MAYGLRLRIEYKDINEVLTQINIYRRDYSGTADVRYAPAAFKAEWGDQGSSDSLPPCVYGSSVTVYLDAEIDFEYLGMFSADSKKYLVEIKKPGVVFRKWFIEPDSWNEPLIAVPYPCQFTAYDGLGYLSKFNFEPTAQPNERQTIETIVTDILNSTGLGLAINFNIDFAENGGGNYLADTIDTSVFEGMKKMDVLNQLLTGCRIYQRSGEWFVDSNKQLSEKSVTYTDYWREDTADFDVLPALKTLTVKQDFGYQKNVLKNGSFATYNSELALFETWLNLSVTPQQRELNKDGDKYVYIPGQQYPGSYASQGYGLINHCLKKTLAVKQTDSNIKFDLKYALMGAKYSSLMFIGLRIVGSSATYYLRREHYYETTEPKWEWINMVDKPSQGDAHICLKSHSAVSAYTGIILKHPYYNTFDNVTAYPFDTITDHFENFSAAIDGFPISGELQIYLYVPYTDRAQIAGSCFTGITLTLLNEEEEEYPTEKTYVITNDLNNNETPDNIELKVGDYPDIINNKLIYHGGFRRTDDDTPTVLWTYPGSAITYSYAEFIGRSLAAIMKTPRQRYNAKLSDVIPLDLVVFEDVENPGKKFIEVGLTYNDETQTCEGQYAEVLEFDIDGFTVENSTIVVLPETARQPEKVAKVENIEERVQLIDENGALVSAPGYLYANDFEFKKEDPADLESDGKTRLQIKREAVTPYNLDPAAGQLQFSLTSVAEVNFAGDANQVNFSAGQFLIHNFNALDKDDRLKALES